MGTRSTRILEGTGALDAAPEVLRELGAKRVLLVATARHRAGANALAEALGADACGVLAIAEPHVPRAVVDAALAEVDAREADWVVAHGGGTAIGLAKGIALQRPVPIGAVVTTYSGSEMTPIWGIREGGVKTTGRDARVKPALVVHDPALLVPLRPAVVQPSLLNAMAHGVEALYAHDADDTHRALARASVEDLLAGMRILHRSPSSLEGAERALRGARIAGQVLGEVSMALHHKLCHTLGGTFGMPHARTHAALLPYSLAYNAPAVPDAMARLREALGDDDPPGALWQLARDHGVETSLEALGLPPDGIDRALDLALAKPYPNPRPLDRAALRLTLLAAAAGRRPQKDGS